MLRSSERNPRELSPEDILGEPWAPPDVIDVRESPNAAAPSGSRSYGFLSAWLLATDVFCLGAALLISTLLFGVGKITFEYGLLLIGAPLVWIGVFHAHGLYASWRLAGVEEFRRTLSATSVGMVLIVMAGYWSQSAFSRGWLGLAWILVLFLEATLRRSWRVYVAHARRDGRFCLRTIVLGTTSSVQRLTGLLNWRELGYAVIGYVAAERGAKTATTIPRLGDADELEEVIRRNHTECLFVSGSDISDDDLATAFRAARQAGAEVRIATALPELLTSRVAVQQAGPVTTLALRSLHLSGSQALLKRTFDVVVASIGLLVALPVMLISAVLIKLTSEGPVFFKQERVTKGGRAFTMYKFRTMRNNADALLAERNIDPSAPFFKLGESDPRLTSVGRVLRRFSLDEFPQLINVIKGDMSLVGPRPLPVEQVAANMDLLESRHEVAAGVTGWWQVRGRSEVNHEAAVAMDVFYIENWSLTLDFYILLKTVGAVLGGKGAF